MSPISTTTGATMSEAGGQDLRALLEQVRRLREQVAGQAERRLQAWPAEVERAGFGASRANLAHYLALRQHDLRPVQAALQPWGVSSRLAGYQRWWSRSASA